MAKCKCQPRRRHQDSPQRVVDIVKSAIVCMAGERKCAGLSDNEMRGTTEWKIAGNGATVKNLNFIVMGKNEHEPLRIVSSTCGTDSLAGGVTVKKHRHTLRAESPQFLSRAGLWNIKRKVEVKSHGSMPTTGRTASFAG